MKVCFGENKIGFISLAGTGERVDGFVPDEDDRAIVVRKREVYVMMISLSFLQHVDSRSGGGEGWVLIATSMSRTRVRYFDCGCG